MLVVNQRIQVPESELTLTFARSGGPGGQNVNKVSSKAILDWDLDHSIALPDDVRERFIARYRRRITRDGRVQIIGQRYRDQARNIDDCRARLIEMITTVLVAPVKRKATAPSRAAKQRRLSDKHARADRKESRRRPMSD